MPPSKKKPPKQDMLAAPPRSAGQIKPQGDAPAKPDLGEPRSDISQKKPPATNAQPRTDLQEGTDKIKDRAGYPDGGKQPQPGQDNAASLKATPNDPKNTIGGKPASQPDGLERPDPTKPDPAANNPDPQAQALDGRQQAADIRRRNEGSGTGTPASEIRALIDELYTGTAEKTVALSPYHPDSFTRPYNPDDLVQKDQSYKIYEDMEKDDQVSVCMRIKKDLVLGSGWDMIIEDDDDEDPEEVDAEDGDPTDPTDPNADPAADPEKKKLFAAGDPPEDPPLEGDLEDQQPRTGIAKAKPDDVETTGESIEPDQDEVREDLERAFTDDLDVPLEDLLEQILDAYGKGFSLTEKIFRYRDDGSLTLGTLKTRHPATWLIHTDDAGNVGRYEQRGSKGSQDIDPRSLIHYVNQPRYQNPYGRSDLRAAHDAWFVKRQIIRFYAIYLEKAASPTPVARYDKNAPTEAVDAIFDAIKRLQTKTALTIPKEIEMEFLEAKSDGEAYVKGINIFNMFIGRAMIIPDLLGFQGAETGGGSYNLGENQFLILYKHLLRRRKTLEHLINRHLVKPIVVWNHGLMDKYPKFKFRPITDDQLVDLAKVWVDAMKGKLYKPSDKEINNFRRIVGFPEGPVEREAPSPSPFGNPFDPSADPSDPNADPGAAQPGKKPPFGKQAKPAAAIPPPAKKAQFSAFESGPYARVDTSPRAKRVDFAGLERMLDGAQADLMALLGGLVTDIVRDLSTQIEKKRMVADRDVGAMDSVKLRRVSEVGSAMRAALRRVYVDSKGQAAREILRHEYKTNPLPDDEFLQVLDDELYQYVGDWEYSLTKQARVAIIEAIKDGKPVTSVIDMLEADGTKAAIVSLERYARTKFTEVMNRGRLDFFNSSGMVAAYEFSAILDDRTTDVCAGLDGKVFEEGTQPIPPLHFNCRSTLVPITRYEDYDVSEKVGDTPIADFIESNKGFGFPAK